MGKHNKTIGNIGENLAVESYKTQGFEIVALNKRTKSGEIDIIAKKHSHTHFIEVKTRTTTKMGNPEEAITTRRHARMVTCAEEYAAENPVKSYQIDVVSILFKPNQDPEIIIFENI